MADWLSELKPGDEVFAAGHWGDIEKSTIKSIGKIHFVDAQGRKYRKNGWGAGDSRCHLDPVTDVDALRKWNRRTLRNRLDTLHRLPDGMVKEFLDLTDDIARRLSEFEKTPF